MSYGLCRVSIRASSPLSANSTLMPKGLKVRSIKRLFEYLEDANRIFINPAESIKEPPKDKTLPRHVLTAKQMQTLLDQPNLGLMTGIRDRTILEVFYATGIRLENRIAKSGPTQKSGPTRRDEPAGRCGSSR